MERVLETHQPKKWTLCVPIEFTPGEIRWFEKLQKDFPGTELAFWGEEKLKSLLAKHQHIREAFFPREMERMVREIHEVVVERTEEPRFSVLELEDVSTALAKRYSANVLMQGDPTQSRIREVVRQATEVVKSQTHYRNRLREEYWGDREAHVVWLFVYTSLEDVGPVNWVCRSLWIDPGLDDRARPSGVGYEEELNGILVDWNDRYEALREFYSERTLDKGGFLRFVDRICEDSVPLIERAVDLLRAYSQGELDEDGLTFKMQKIGEAFRPHYLASGELGFPPNECQNLDRAFQGLMAQGDNIFLPFTREGLEKWESRQRTYLADTAAEGAYEKLLRFRVLRDQL